MKLHLPSGLRNAVLSCMALVSSVLPATLSAGALVGGVCMLTMQETQAAFVTNTSPDPNHEYSEDVLYAGDIYDMDANASGQFHDLLPTDAWKNFCTGAAGDDGHTLRIRSTSATGQNISINTDFAPLTLGGLIVEKSNNTYTIGRTDLNTYVIELQAAAGQDVNFLILSDTKFVGYTTNGTMANIHNNTNWRVGSGNTLTWTSPLNVVLQNNCKINIINYATDASANPANVAIERMLQLKPGSSLNIGRDTVLTIGTGELQMASISTAMTTTVNVAAGGTLNLNASLQLGGIIHNEGTINFTPGAILQVIGYDSRTFTKDHAYYHLTIIDGNGVVNNWETLKLMTYFGTGWTTKITTQNGYTIVFERDVKEVTLPTLTWTEGAVLNEKGETYDVTDALWFSTDTEATLSAQSPSTSLKLTAAYIEKGHTLTINEASTTPLSIAGELLLGGDLVLTREGQLKSGYIFSQGGRIVLDFARDGSRGSADKTFDDALPSGVDYTGNIVIRSGRIKLGSRKINNLIIEDGGQLYIDQRTYNGDITLAGFGFDQSNASRHNDSKAAIRIDNGASVTGTIHLSDDAAIQVYQGTGTIGGGINGHGHIITKQQMGGTLNVNKGIFDAAQLILEGGTLNVNDGITNVDLVTVIGGTLNVNGDISGTNEISMTGGTMTINGTLVNTGAALNIAGGTLIVTQNWDDNIINKTGNGTLRFTGKVTTGDVTFTQAGTIEFLGEVDGTGTLTIDGTTVKLGTAQAHTNAFHYDTVHVLAGGAFHVQHAAADFLDTSITLEGGTLRMVDMDEDGDNHDTTMKFKDLLIQGGSGTTSAIEFVWNGGFTFQRLTGDGNFTLKKEQGASTEPSTLAFDEVYNYSGTISWVNGSNHNRLTLRIGSIHQDNAYSANVEADVTSGDLVMTGAGNFSITGTLTADSIDVQGSGTLTINGNANSNIDMTGSGTLNVTGTLTSADFRVRNGNVSVGMLESTGDLWMNYDGTLTLNGLHIGRDTNLRYSESESSVLKLTSTGGDTGWITSDNLSFGIVYIYTYDLSAEALAKGVCLGLSSASIDESAIAILGISYKDCELYAGDDGSWYLRAKNGATADPLGTDGMWDEAWGNELSRRPTEAIPEASGFAIHPDGQTQTSTKGIWLARDDQYSSRGGLVRWAKLTEDTAANETAPLYVFGGNVNSNNTNSTDTLTTDVWIDIEGGHYAVVAGGYDARDGSGVVATTFNGNVHLAQQAGTTDRLIGGSYGTGARTNFNGNTYISVFGGSVDSIIGGSAQDNTIIDSTREMHFTGDSRIYIYDVLEKTDVPNSAPYDQSHNFIVGGNAHLNRNGSAITNFTGTSSIIIDLGGKYANTRSGMEFGKRIIGGDIVTGSEGTVNHRGDTYVYITGADGVTFTERIFGGSYDDGDSRTINIEGSTHIGIDSGIYANMIVGGSNQGVLDATSGNSGTSGGNVNLTITGDTNILITGGEFRGYDSTLGTNRNNVDNHSIGNVAIVGGNYHSEVSNTSTDFLDYSTINGNTNITIIDGRFLGHIAGASAVEGMPPIGGLNYFHTGLSVGGSNVTMLGGEMVKNPGDSDVDPNDWVPRIVGGFLLHSAAGNRPSGTDQSPVTIGDINVTIGGTAITYDVIGGSWTSCLDSINIQHTWRRVTHGNITINLTGTATIKGDVYAAGIQGGAAGMETASTTINIGSGVVFDKELGDFTIVSGGYLSTSKTNHGTNEAPEWEENQDAYGTFYATDNDTTSSVTGKRVLNLTDAVDYGTGLSNVRLLNFDEVNVKSGAEVTVESLFITEAGLDNDHQNTTLAGGGTLSLQGKLIEIPDGTDATQQVLNNGSIIVTDGSTLRFLSSGHTGDRAISYVNQVEVGDGSKLQLDLNHEYAISNDRVYVNNGIAVNDNGSIVVNVRLTQDMFGSQLGDALITRMPDDLRTPDATAQAALTLNNAYFELNFRSLDLMTDAGKELNFVVADYVDEDGNTTFNTGRNGSLYKWFGDNANLTVEDDDATNMKRIVFSGTVVSADTADYHRANANSANGYAGGRLLDALYSTKNPEYNTPTSDGAQLLSAMEAMLNAGDYAAADRTMAAAAGASIAALGSALSDDVERQLRAIRNRTTTMVSEYSEETLNMNFWLNAEGDYRKLQGDNTDSGYKLNSWGGTVGVSAQVSEDTTLGVALTAMYGDFEAQAPDKLKGDLNTSYLSAFARVADGNWSHVFVATAGLATVDAKRTVQHTLGSYTNKVDTEGYTVGLLYEVGYTMMLNETGTACLQPMMNISWRHSQLNAFTEPGSDVGLQVSDQTYDALTLGAGLRTQAMVGETVVNRSAILEARALLKGYFGDARNSATVGFVDLPQRVSVRSRDLGRVGVELGAGLTLPVTSSGESALFIDASAEIRNSYTNFNATIGWKTTF